MQLNSYLSFTASWMFYLQTEAVLKASLPLNWRLLHWDCIARTVFKWFELSWENIREIDKLSYHNFNLNWKRRFNICGNYS